MRIEDLRYELRPENLAGTPREVRLGSRDLGRLLVVERASGRIFDRTVLDLPNIFEPGDLLILNNSKRIPGVLRGRTEFGGQVELRFVDLAEEGTGLCRIFPQHDVPAGSVIALDGGGEVYIAELDVTKYGLARVESVGNSLRALLCAQGTPILGFFYDDLWSVKELNPFYATEEGSVESPLAGLHFTRELVDALRNAGIGVEFVTLHSVGSWLPFLEDTAGEHTMWAEAFSIPAETAKAVKRTRSAGGKIFACGSTSLRALESAAVSGRTVEAMTGRTDLYIMPGYQFKIVDGYFTNFHQYQTSLMVLDCAVAGTNLAKRAYAKAARLGYHFYEFGDAVLYL
jgi:S-adenosylmethionine:tRNA ribosyltransferase-isomerase